jgi:GNAT superfamily N-acetyltransferase
VIRAFREDDAAGVVALLREADPTHVVTEAAIVHRHRTIPPKAQLGVWVVEGGGRVLGHGRAYVAWDTSEAAVGELGVTVAPDARGRGVGSTLYERAVSHLREAGARTAGAWALPEGARFLERRGHEHRRSSRQSALDLREADLTGLRELEERKGREGFRLVTLGEVFDRPRDLFELDVVTSRDEPSEYPIDAMSYDDWLRTSYEQPTLDHDGSRIVVTGDDHLVAWALLGTDGAGRGLNEFTATRPEYRGRGLARLAKLSVATWARDNGIDLLYTGNDAVNAPMLAINRRMGYRPTGKRHYLVRDISPSPGAAAESDRTAGTASAAAVATTMSSAAPTSTPSRPASTTAGPTSARNGLRASRYAAV